MQPATTANPCGSFSAPGIQPASRTYQISQDIVLTEFSTKFKTFGASITTTGLFLLPVHFPLAIGLIIAGGSSILMGISACFNKEIKKAPTGEAIAASVAESFLDTVYGGSTTILLGVLPLYLFAPSLFVASSLSMAALTAVLIYCLPIAIILSLMGIIVVHSLPVLLIRQFLASKGLLSDATN